MLDFLFKKETVVNSLNATIINEIYAKLKGIYDFESVSLERKALLTELIEKYGYLPYPQIKALEELTPAEVLFSLEFKFKNEGIFNDGNFNFERTSPLTRNSIQNSDWIKKEGHDIKLINLAALGNGNKDKTTGKFIDWFRQLVILPAGNASKGIFATSVYLVPFQKREFGCAYLPKSTEVSVNLEDNYLKETLELDAKAQVQLFVALAQLAGHPVIYDILPQTGRFAKIVLANPFIARWFDLKEFSINLQNCIELVAKELEQKFDKEDIGIVKNIYRQGGKGELNQDYQKIYDEFERNLAELKKARSNDMLKKENQAKIQKRVQEIVAQIQGEKPNKQFKEEEITKQHDIIQKLMAEGLWTAPGGAWCSSGVPIFDKMSDCGAFPIFKHYDFKGDEVSEFANLDCQTPFYFVTLENGQYNKPVIEFFINFVKKLQSDYNFDGFRIDHVDHVVDEVSQKNGVPISYRIPAKILGELNSSLKSKIPYFAAIAEYMGTEFLTEYHQKMNFDVLWGNDIPAQDEKTPEQILEDNQNLANYNSQFSENYLSILKTYNNQDGEFGCIDKYPGQLGEQGALFKWFKYKFLSGGKLAQRPMLYVDGDESFTKTGIEETIGSEVSMKREKNYDFFDKFDAINRLAKSQELVTEGEARIILQEDDGFVSWMISKEPLKTSMLVVANYLVPTDEDAEEIIDKTINLPGDYKIKSEFVFDGKNFIETEIETDQNSLHFEKLEAGEFKIYLLTK